MRTNNMNKDPLSGVIFGAMFCAFGLMMAFSAAKGVAPSRNYRWWDVFLTSRTPSGEKNYRLLWTGVLFAVIGAFVCIQQIIQLTQ